MSKLLNSIFEFFSWKLIRRLGLRLVPSIWFSRGLAFGALGFVTNLCRLELFFQVDLLFGSVWVMLAIALFGFRAGLVAGVIAALSTFWLWNHPWAILIFSTEAAFVGYFMQRKRATPFASDLIYWILPGCCLVIFSYGGLMGLEASSVILIALKQSTNGMMNALLASTIFYILPKRLRGEKEILFRHALLLVMSAFVMIPAILITAIHARSHRASEESRLMSEVRLWSRTRGDVVDQWISDHLTKVANVASAIGDPVADPAQSLQEKIESIHQVSSSFVRMGVFGPDAIARAYSPRSDAAGASNLGMNVSDRDYFADLLSTKKPMVSNAMLSKTSMQTPIIAFLAPVQRNGQFRGFCSAVYDDKWIKGLARTENYPANLHQTLLDRRGRVIVSSRPDLEIMQFYREHPGGTKKDLGDGLYHWIPALLPGVSVMQRWRNSLFVEERVLGGSANWKLVTETSVTKLFNDLTHFATVTMLSLFLLLLLVYFLSNWFSSILTAGVCQLGDATRHVSEKVRSGDTDLRLPNVAFSEFSDLVSNFRIMVESLRTLFQEQKRFVVEEKRLLKEKELIIRDLHDGVGGIVANIAMLAEYGVGTRDLLVREGVLRKIVGLAREGSCEVRSFMNSAFCGESGWPDLVAEIKEYCTSMLEEHGVSVSFSSSITAVHQPGFFQYCNIMRIARESICNILKHASASHIEIVFRVSATNFFLEIRDDGVGFDAEQVRKRGIANMYSRAGDLGANLTIESGPGSTVRLEMGIST